MPEEEKRFWTTLPGILTGIAAVLTAATGLYLAFPSGSDEPQPALTALTHPISEAAVAPSDWPLILDETFTDRSNGWSTGNFPTEYTPRFDLRIVDGKYRWDVGYSLSWQRFVLAPTGTAVNFNLGVDVKVMDYTPETAVSLIFAATESLRYAFTVSLNGKYNLATIVGLDASKELLIYWSPFSADFDPKEWNRLGVVVNNQVISLYINSKLVGDYREANLSGGKVGLGLDLFQEGIAVVDFDNFQLRRK
jgi:hypothetical protein